MKESGKSFTVQLAAVLFWLLPLLGMPLAFDEDKADLSKLGHATGDRLYIGEVLHKTFISVAEKGTKAGAVTAEILCGSTAMPEKPHEVHLDHPFMYMIIDCENNVPFFIGTVTSVEG